MIVGLGITGAKVVKAMIELHNEAKEVIGRISTVWMTKLDLQDMHVSSCMPDSKCLVLKWGYS